MNCHYCKNKIKKIHTSILVYKCESCDVEFLYSFSDKSLIKCIINLNLSDKNYCLDLNLYEELSLIRYQAVKKYKDYESFQWKEVVHLSTSTLINKNLNEIRDKMKNYIIFI